jgi:thymidylate kinase
VLRNYDDLPRYTGNDIDILVAPRERRRAERVLVSAAHNCGFRLHHRAEFATLALYFSSPATGIQAHFDLFTRLTWRGFAYLDCSRFLARRMECGLFYIPHPADEAISNLFSYAIYSGRVKERYKASITAGVKSDPWHAQLLLTETYGRRNARFIVDRCLLGHWDLLEKRLPALRRRLVVRQLNRRPIFSAIRLSSEFLRAVRRVRRPAGLSLVLCGVDGCGKSTAAAAVSTRLATTFSPLKSRHFHWKLPMFSTCRRAERTGQNPHGKPARSRPLSLVYFLFHWLEFFLGSWLSLPALTFRGGLVTIDRFYYDFFVDQRRYRLQVPQRLVTLGFWFLNKPDLVILLDAPAEVLHQRKPELSLDETKRQRQAYLQLVHRLPNGILIDASRPADQVAHEISRSVLEFMAQRLGCEPGIK